MDLKMPKEWLENPEDAEDEDGAESFTQRSSSMEELQRPGTPIEPVFEDYEYRYEYDSDVADGMGPDIAGESGIVILELLVPNVERTPIESRQSRNRHRRNGRSRRSERLLRRSRRSRRSRRLRRSRSRRSSRSEHHPRRAPEADSIGDGLFSLRPSGRPSYQNRLLLAPATSSSGTRDDPTNSRQHRSSSF